MSSGEQQIGIVCGRCEAFCSLDAAICSACEDELELRVKPSKQPQPSLPQADLVALQEAATERPPPKPTSRSQLERPAPAREPPQEEYVEPKAPPPGLKAKTAEEKPMEPTRHYVCRSCSSAVPAGHKFCGRCGTPVPPEIRELKTNYFGDMQNPTKAKLILIRGEGMDGLSFHLKAEQHIVGREGQLIFPDDPFVSPRHANFFYRDGSLVVRDEGSLNGVYIRIRGTVPISPGSTFLAGEQLFRLELMQPISDDQAEPDGTAFYASPRKDSNFRICQIFRGAGVGMTVHASGDSMVVGRDGADLNFPEDLFMSGEHCRIDDTGGGKFTLTDLDSRNGTYVRIDDERVLKHGDYVFIGRKLLRVELNTN